MKFNFAARTQAGQLLDLILPAKPEATFPHASTAVASGVTDYIVVVSNEDDYHAGFHHFAE
jgi:hypothetical protein